MAIHTGTETGNGQDSGPPPVFETHLALMADLEAAVRPFSTTKMLAIFALGGFDDYVDLYGRLVGQDLLARIGDRLAEAIDQPASFYRPRGTEYAVILDAPPTMVDQFLMATASPISEQLAQYNLTLAFGAVMLPEEASEAIEALKLADERLSLNVRARKKRERRSSSPGQRSSKPGRGS